MYKALEEQNIWDKLIISGALRISKVREKRDIRLNSKAEIAVTTSSIYAVTLEHKNC